MRALTLKKAITVGFSITIALMVPFNRHVVKPVHAQRSGAAVYSQNCARCHGADGRAQTPKGRQAGAVDLTSDEWSPDAQRDIRLVTKGKGNMPTFRGKLSAAEIEAVVQYIRRFKN